MFARAMFLPALIAAIVGLIPIIPTIDVTTVSTSSNVAASIIPSIPDRTFTPVSAIFILSSFALSALYKTAISGLNSRICFSINSTLEPAASTLILSSSVLFLTISSVCVPIEPVEPRTAIFFIVSPNQSIISEST